MKRVVISVNIICCAILFFVLTIDLFTLRKRNYSRNLTNTVITVILTIAVMTGLYGTSWHKGLNEAVIRLDSDNVVSPRFPAIAFFQGNGESTQANIQLAEFKCVSGDWTDHSELCSALTVSQNLESTSCDCGDRWPTLEQMMRGDNKMTWLGKETSYFAMAPSETTVSRGEGHFMHLQVFFNYNTSASLANESVTTAPGVWMAVYDARYDIRDALRDGYLQSAQIDANGHTVINVGLSYYEYLDRPPVYKYDLAFATRQNLDLVCDVTKEGWYNCHVALEVQIPSFLRTIARQEKRMTWSRVIADAGAYFALVQFLSWIGSGQAWAI
ncbi:hypothetical protein K505DRAFT_301396 [Melanomma pulvis-pyrius CBS 109.77]|uniref:Uncharacterized protein n=1 Tax=Melanomma pulvis-pyrius CBS 109.77 TaxID=1314802 RepID=A0A6A6XHG7_9PLEO|nr:hypothetical protein K505DRAFT_301396 [Melanomma pulvis-pyrius CBS 109.77]